MRIFALTFLILAAGPIAQAKQLLPLRKQLLEGDWSSQGGGSGIACFATKSDAEKADPFLREGKLLPKDLLDKAQIQVLESWEMDQYGAQKWAPASGESWLSIHSKLHQALARAYPLFSDRLSIASEWAKFSRWEKLNSPSSSLALLEDAKPIDKLPPLCRSIQLVIRFSNGNNSWNEGPATGDIQMKIVYVAEYVAKLSPLDFAMLNIHEEFYALGQAIGHNDSDSIRGFVRAFFNKGFLDAYLENSTPYLMLSGDAAMKPYLIVYFGDYLEFFSDTHKPGNGPAFTSKRHFDSFMNFLRRERPAVVACRKAGGADMECSDKFLNPGRMAKLLNEEESFLYVSNFYLEQTLGYLNSDYLMRPVADDDLFRTAMRASCRKISEGLQFVPEIQALESKAAAYCKSWEASQPRK